MPNVNTKDVINSSLITAFTIAAALIWKDVITELIELLIPNNGQLFSQLIAAILATIFVIGAIYIILKTEDEAESVVKKIRGRQKTTDSQKASSDHQDSSSHS